MSEQGETIATAELLERMEAVGAPIPRTTLKHWLKEGFITPPVALGRYARYRLRSLGEAGLVWRLREHDAKGVVTVTTTGIKEALAFTNDLQEHWVLAQRWLAPAIIGNSSVPQEIWGGSPSRAEVLVTGACAFFKAVAGINLMQPARVVFHWVGTPTDRPETAQWKRDVISICESDDDAIHSGALRPPDLKRFTLYSQNTKVLAEVPFV